MEEKKLEQIDQFNSNPNKSFGEIKIFTEDYKQHLKSLLELKKWITTAEKLGKIQPFIEKIESYTWQELSSKLYFWWPNNWFDDQWRNDCNVDNPHWYGFVDIEWLYDSLLGDWVYFRIDTLIRDPNEGRYVECSPTLKIVWITLPLKLKSGRDSLLEKSLAYKRLVRDRMSEKYRENKETGDGGRRPRRISKR